MSGLTAIDVIAASTDPVAAAALGAHSSPEGAVTLLLSDLADAAALRAELGDERWAELVRDHGALRDALVVHHDGEVVREHEDGCMAAFASAHAAAHCAVELQRTFAGAERPLALRVGVHTGFVLMEGTELMGRNVVLAARIAGQATGGQILVSSALRDYTEGDDRLRFAELGEFHFKGLVGQHVVHVLAWDA
jgi:class 3 adenylate cyclase